MPGFLKQSTATTVKMGPFVDSTDGNTAETALTIAQADIRVSKNGGAYAQTDNAAGATHDENGEYGVPLAATDLNTLGILKVLIHVSGALAVWDNFMVVSANVYNSLFDSTDVLDVSVTQWLGTAVTLSATTTKPEVDVNSISDDATAANNAELMFDGTGYAGGTAKLTVDTVAISGDTTAADNAEAMFDGTGYAGGTIKLGVDTVAISGDTTAADNLEADYDGTGYQSIRENTAQAGAAGTITLDASANATDDTYNGLLCWIRSGTGAGQARYVYDYVGSTKVASVSPDWTTNPDVTSKFVLLPQYPGVLMDSADADDFTASLAAKISLITSGTSINIQSTITDGSVFTILQGESRKFADGNHIRIDVDGTVTDLTGFTPKFALTKLTSNSGTASLEVSGTVVNAGLSTQYVYYELTAVQTAAFALDTATSHPYRITSNYAYRWDASATDASTCPGIGTGFVSVKAMATTC